MPARKERGLYEHPPESGVWWIEWYDHLHKRHREKAGTKSAARILYAARKSDALLRRKLPQLHRASVRVGELLGLASERAKSHHRGARLGADGNDYRYSALVKLVGDSPADSITPQEIERSLSKLAQERNWSPASFNRHRAFLSLAFRLGIENGKVESNPVRRVVRRHEENGRVRFLSDSEESRLREIIEALYPDQLPAFDLALHCGMRRSEQYGLRWEYVDTERRVITIPRSKHGAMRHLPLDGTALQALRELRKRFSGSGKVMVAATNGRGKRAGESLKSPRAWFESACEKAGIDNFTWHDLRHTFASRLVMAGVDLRTVQELMGHKTIQMTTRYAHLSPGHQQEAVNRLDSWKEKVTATKTATRKKKAS